MKQKTAAPLNPPKGGTFFISHIRFISSPFGGVVGALLCLFLISSCSVKRPAEVLSDSEMEEVLYDYHIARALGDEAERKEDYKRVLLTEAVFKKHGITKTDFDTSMVWFSRNPDILAKVYEKVNARLKAERDAIDNLIALREEKPKEFTSGDSVDVWTGRPFYRLTPAPLDNKLAFTFTADTTFHDRDTLRWSVRFRFNSLTPLTPSPLGRGSDKTPTNSSPLPTGEGLGERLLPLMAMQVKYEKRDSIVGTYQRIDTADVQTLTLWADTLGAIKEVSGFIYLPKSDSLRTLWADQITLMRYRAKDSLVIATDSLATDTVPKTEVEQPDVQKPVEQPAGRQARPVRPRPRA